MNTIQPVHLGGSGQNILLLHGFGADSQSWLGNAPALFNSGSVWSLELPGHGDAGSNSPAQSLSAIAEQLMPALVELSDTPVHLIGHSLGGALLLLCAASLPNKTASLTLLAPVGLGVGVDAGFLRSLPLLTEPVQALQLLQTTVHNPKLISPQIAPLILAKLARDGVKQGLQVCAQAIQNTDPKLHAAIESVVATNIPRQVIWGQDDNINPPMSQDQELFGGQWHKLNNCGHLPHVEHRTTVNKIFADFIHDNSPAPAGH